MSFPVWNCARLNASVLDPREKQSFVWHFIFQLLARTVWGERSEIARTQRWMATPTGGCKVPEFVVEYLGYIYIFFTHYILLMSNAKKEMGHIIEQEQTVSLLHVSDSLCTNSTASADKWHVCILKLDLSIINQQPQSMLAIYHMSKKDWWWKFLSPFFFKRIVAS